jgi:GNAT superfamily N-acetyltransferase
MQIDFSEANETDAPAIAAVRIAAAGALTARFGEGHWSSIPTERAVIHSMRHAKVVIGRVGARVIAVARVGTKKPWAIDVACFTACRRPLYLTDMAVGPEWQRKGIGRQCLDEAVRVARAWPGDALRLDAYDAPAGAGAFYAKYGFVERGRATSRGTPLIYYELLLGEVDACRNRQPDAM